MRSVFGANPEDMLPPISRRRRMVVLAVGHRQTEVRVRGDG